MLFLLPITHWENSPQIHAAAYKTSHIPFLWELLARICEFSSNKAYNIYPFFKISYQKLYYNIFTITLNLLQWNCNMFPRKEACPYHLWHSKWSYCLHPDGYIQHLWGNHSTVSSSLHSGQLNQHTDIPGIYMYRNHNLQWSINKTTSKYTCAIKTCKKIISLSNIHILPL